MENPTGVVRFRQKLCKLKLADNSTLAKKRSERVQSGVVWRSWVKLQNCVIILESWSFKQLFSWSITSSKVILLLPLCSSLERSKHFSQKERSRHDRISKKWLDFEKIMPNLGSFPDKGILNFRYCKLCHHGVKRLAPLHKIIQGLSCYSIPQEVAV